MFLGLRMNRGVSISLFQERFGVDIMTVYQMPIEHFVREKLLYNLPESGMLDGEGHGSGRYGYGGVYAFVKRRTI